MRISVRASAICAGFSFLLLCVNPAVPAEEAPYLGRIVEQAGPVTILRSGRGFGASTNMEILLGDRVLTGPRSRVRIEFDDRTGLVIGPDTDVEISRYLAPGRGGSSRLLGLLRGILRLVGVPGVSGEGLRVRTRAAIASVRSTVWIVEATPEETAVLVLSGRVIVESSRGDGAVVVRSGEGTIVPLDAAPGRPTVWSEERAEEVLARTRFR